MGSMSQRAVRVQFVVGQGLSRPGDSMVPCISWPESLPLCLHSSVSPACHLASKMRAVGPECGVLGQPQLVQWCDTVVALPELQLHPDHNMSSFHGINLPTPPWDVHVPGHHSKFLTAASEPGT